MFYNYPLDITSDEWEKLLCDRSVTTEQDLDILKTVYESKNHEARSSEVASVLNIANYRAVNILIVNFGKRVIKKTGAHPSINRKGRPRWWHVPFLGYEKGGKYPWIMRPELVEACERVFGQVDTELIFPDEVVPKDSPTLPDGAVMRTLVNRYERSRRARSICIAHYGTKCIICGFDFEKVYGPIGKNKIHVHHIVPLSKIRKEYQVNPVRDLRPVCPNCHFIIHSKEEPFTIEEMKKLIGAKD